MADNFSDQIKEMSTQELETNLAKGVYGYSNSIDNRRYGLVTLELERRRRKIEEERFNKSLNIAEDNIINSKNLVKATWALAVVTFLLVLATLMPLVISFIKSLLNSNN